MYRVLKTGWKRALPEEIAEGESSVPHAISRKAKRASRRLASCDYASLTPDAKRSHDATSTVLGAIQIVASCKTTQKILKQANETGINVDVAGVLQLCK
jgi:hypothetical protein